MSHIPGGTIQLPLQRLWPVASSIFFPRQTNTVSCDSGKQCSTKLHVTTKAMFLEIMCHLHARHLLQCLHKRTGEKWTPTHSRWSGWPRQDPRWVLCILASTIDSIRLRDTFVNIHKKRDWARSHEVGMDSVIYVEKGGDSGKRSIRAEYIHTL